MHRVQYSGYWVCLRTWVFRKAASSILLLAFYNDRSRMISGSVEYQSCRSASTFSLLFHSSEIRGECLMKYFSETFQNWLYFSNTRKLMHSFHLLFLYTNKCPGPCWNRMGHSLEKKYSIWVFIFQKFWRGYFIKHEPLISEEWFRTIVS